MAEWSIDLSQNWLSKPVRMRAASAETKAILQSLTLSNAAEARREAQRQLDMLVYQAPLPRSARPGYKRSGATRRAVKMMPTGIASLLSAGAGAMDMASFVAGIYVDRQVANRKGFFYPFILNRGRTDVRYAARPFWSNMKAIMGARYRAGGRTVLREIKRNYERA